MSFEQHRKNGHVTLASHVSHKKVELGRSVSSLQKIYLDLRFWIMFRDAYLTPDKQNSVHTLLLTLISLVQDGVAICPISESTFMELLKQKDLSRRKEKAKLIDLLSKGVTLIMHKERVTLELEHALFQICGVDYPIPLHNRVWTKLSYVLGEFHPVNKNLAQEDQLAIQKSFFDHMWNITLSEIMDFSGEMGNPYPDWDQTASKLNEGNQLHKDVIRSYPHVFRAEFEGVLNLFHDEFIEALKKISNLTGERLSVITLNLTDAEKFKAFTRSVPTLYIGASCHAAIRWDKRRKLKGNDLLDFHHAEAALAYCDVFLTEKPLKTMLEQKHLGLSEIFPCNIFSSAEKATDWLSKSHLQS